MALDELRKNFPVMKWKENGNTQLTQEWFAGVHSDIGGGYPLHGLSDIAYKWIQDAAMASGIVSDLILPDGFRECPDQELNTLGGKQQECCCEMLRAVDGVNYNQAINTAAINANTTQQTQKILDAIMGNRMADMSAQIQQLQLQQAMTGVLRFPTAWSYAAGPFPPLVSGGTTTG